MTIQVLFFSFAAERMNGREHRLTVPEGATVGTVAAALAERLGMAPDRFRYAVNDEWATPATPLADGDVLAVIPPVAGG